MKILLTTTGKRSKGTEVMIYENTSTVGILDVFINALNEERKKSPESMVLCTVRSDSGTVVMNELIA